MKKILILTMLLSLWVPVVFALPTAEGTTLAWDSYENQSGIEGFYVYWTPRDASIPCRDHKTYSNAARHQLPDPAATKLALSVFLPGKLKDLCFALTVYNKKNNESGFAMKSTKGNDYHWTGMIAPTEFLAQ